MPSSLLVRVVFGALVLATFGAFIVAQRLKRTTPIVRHVYYPHYIGPKCHCQKAVAHFIFAPARAGRVTATIVNSAGDDVRTLVDGARLSKREHRYWWNGRNDAGVIAPDGVYQLRVTLLDEGRSITLPRKITLDTVPPRPRIIGVTPSTLVPGAPGRLSRAEIRFAHTIARQPLIQIYRTDLPRPRLVAAFQPPPRSRSGTWDGFVNGTPAADGIYVVTITDYDRAGNAGSAPRRLPPTSAEAVPGTGISVRYLTLSGSLVPAGAGSVAHFQVGPEPRRVRWSLVRASGGRPLAHGKALAGALPVRIPRRASTGMYVLGAQAAGQRAAEPVVVQGRGHGPVLVVLPAIAWQGANRVDDNGDGFPNTLMAGDSVRTDRAFAHGRLPAGLTQSIEPLLRFLSGTRARYEITTDLALARDGGGELRGKRGVLFAGDETWLTQQLDLALRGYVERGGRVASLGTDSFRRRVTLAGDELSGPTSPEQVNVFGEQVGELRIAEAPMVVNATDSLGLFRGVSGGLFGLFTQFEQSQRLVGGAQILASAGRDPAHPAFVAYRLGKGIVVRVGTPGWGAALPKDIELGDITRRIWSLLSQ